MPPLETLLRQNGETYLYLIFFGAILLFGILETFATIRAAVAQYSLHPAGL